MSVLRRMGLPGKLRFNPVECYEKGMALLETIRQAEVAMTAWEDAQDPEFLELLPWWPARKEYREKKARGEVEEPTWWQALSQLERSHPKRFACPMMWSIAGYGHTGRGKGWSKGVKGATWKRKRLSEGGG